MPQKTTKKVKASQKDGEVKAPNASLDSITVRDCMVWPHGGGHEPIRYDPETERETKFLIKKGEIGKPVSRGYVMPEEQPRQVEDEGTVIQALRGWPNDRRNAQQDEEEEYDHYGCAEDAYISGGQKPSSGKGKKHSGKTGDIPNGKGDPPMVYLVAHKYMSDHERKRMEEAEAERQQKERKSRPKKYCGETEVKTTKGAQLRAIHLAGQVETNPKDLWQMSKFKKARSNLDTFRKNEKKNKGGRSGGRDGADGCTCGLNMNVSGQAVEDTPRYDYTDAEIAALCDEY